MIELFKQVIIPVDATGFDALKTKLQHTVVGGPWSYTSDRVLDYSPSAKSSSFAYRGGPLPEANLSVAWYDGEASIGNIVPTNFGQLTTAEYNALLDDFFDRHLHQVLIVLNLQYTKTASRRDISDWIGPIARQKLQVFSGMANKGSGSSHPADHARWQDFIIAVHREGAQLPSDILRRWLVEEMKWPDTVAMDLAAEYGDAIDLLKRYDELP